MRHKNLRKAVQIRRDYDQARDSYDRIRFGTPGGQYVDRKEQDFVASIIKGSRVLEVGYRHRKIRGYTHLSRSRVHRRRPFTNDVAGNSGTDKSVSFSTADGRMPIRFQKLLQLCHMCAQFPLPTKSGRGSKRDVRRITASGKCVVTFETDNFLRRLMLPLGTSGSEQYYYKISDVEDMFLKSGFKVVQSGSVLRMPVTIYRRCPRLFLPLLKQLERL
jgi:hypothetical protein